MITLLYVPYKISLAIAIFLFVAIVLFILAKLKEKRMKKAFTPANIIIISILSGLIIFFTANYFLVKEATIFRPAGLDFKLLVPSTLMSIILSIMAVAIMVFFFLKIRQEGMRHVLSYKNVLIAIGLVIAIVGINNAIRVWPYGTLGLSLLNYSSQIVLFGILIPYLFVCEISYLFLIFKGPVRKF